MMSYNVSIIASPKMASRLTNIFRTNVRGNCLQVSLSHARSGDVFGRMYVRVFQYVRPYICVGVFLVHVIRVTLISRRTHGHARSHLAAYLGVSVSVCVCVCACVCVCVRAYAHIFHANSSTHTHVCAGVISKRTRWPPG